MLLRESMEIARESVSEASRARCSLRQGEERRRAEPAQGQRRRAAPQAKRGSASAWEAERKHGRQQRVAAMAKGPGYRTERLLAE